MADTATTSAAATATTGAATGATSDQTGTGTTTTGQDWRASLPEPIRGSATLDKFLNAEKTGLDAGKMAESYINLEKAHSAKLEGMIKVPGADAKPEEVAAWRKAVGVPDSVDGYKVELPEALQGTVSDEDLSHFLPIFHASGATPAQVQQIMTGYAQYAKTVQANLLQSNQADFAEWKGKSGATYEHDTALALQALERFGTDDMKAMVRGAKLEDLNIGIVKTFAAIGRVLEEQGAIQVGTAATGFSKEAAQARAHEIASNKEFVAGKHPEQAKLQSEYTRIMRQLYPDPIR